MGRTRPCELSERVWERAQPLLPPAKPRLKGGRPPRTDREMLGAIVYVLRTGLQWNALPREIGASTTVYVRSRYAAERRRYVAYIRPRGEDRANARSLDSAKRPRRWVVERLHSWLNRSRRLLVRWEKLQQTCVAFLHLACALLCFQQCDRVKTHRVSE